METTETGGMVKGVQAFRLINALPVPAFAVDGDGKLTLWNAGMEQLTGRGANEVLGKKAWTAFFPKKRLLPVDEVLDTSEPAEDEIVVTHVGTKAHQTLLAKAAAVLDDAGQLLGAVATLGPPAAGSGDSELVAGLTVELDTMRKAIVAGHLAARIDTTKHTGQQASLLSSINQIVDAILIPIGEGNRILSQIRGGNLRERVEIDCEGDHKKMKEAVNGVHSWLTDLVKYITRIANGDTTATMDKASDKDQIHEGLVLLRSSLCALTVDADMLAKAAVEGKLAARADASKHQGEFRKVVEGVNHTLDAVIGPLHVAANYVDRISKGDIPAKITDSYNGEFNTIKNNLNTCIDAFNALVADTAMLSRSAVEGKLATRADAGKHHGDFRKIVQGVNDTLDAVIGPLNVSATYVERISKGNIPARITDSYSGDFNTIKNNLNTCIDAVNALSADASMLAAAAVEGHLSTRADGTKHTGDFKKIVDGVNATLDSVLAPVLEAADVLQRLSQRDLRVRVKGQYMGDHAKIKDALNGTAESLHDTLFRVAEAVDQITSASTEIASGAQAVAQGASEQASALEETSSSMEEMSSMTQQNADNTQQAKVVAEAAKAAADKGSKAMALMLDSMGKIRAAAEGTAGIIRDINEIAFQTNLLALNAAVEAARAGDAGRGFAVVAEEVRNLAQRAKEAAKKTEELINESVKLAEGGQVISREVNGNLTEITESVAKVTSIVAEIAAASKEQAKGISQVNKAIADMDVVTQQNAASSEEASSASEELAGQAQELAALVGGFQLQRATTGGRSDRRGPAPKALPPAKGKQKSGYRPQPRKGEQPKGIKLALEEVLPDENDADLANF
jgi:methyl-accepting chemotaxis protein